MIHKVFKTVILSHRKMTRIYCTLNKALWSQYCHTDRASVSMPVTAGFY